MHAAVAVFRECAHRGANRSANREVAGGKGAAAGAGPWREALAVGALAGAAAFTGDGAGESTAAGLGWWGLAAAAGAGWLGLAGALTAGFGAGFAAGLDDALAGGFFTAGFLGVACLAGVLLT